MKSVQKSSFVAALLGASLLIPPPAPAVSPTRPAVIITYPTAGLTATNAALTVSGKAQGKTALAGVYYQLNGKGWNATVSTNGWTNWTASVTLTPGTNTLQAYAVDKAGTTSLTHSVSFAYVQTALMTVQIMGRGTVSPNYNGKRLNIAARYGMTAVPSRGFAFVNWTGSLSSSSPTIFFVMDTGLTLTANFKDATPPVLVIRSPAVNQSVTNAVFTVTGGASDNVAVTQVVYRFNGGGWMPAATTNSWATWTAQVTLKSGANIVQAYAQDGAGNCSKTNTVGFVYEPSDKPQWALASPAGLTAQVGSPGDTNTFTISFGTNTFSQTMLPGSNEDDNAAGVYDYTVLDTKTAMLTLINTAPPDRTNHPMVVELLFTSGQSALAITTNSSAGGLDTNIVAFRSQPNLAPDSLAGETIDSKDSYGSELHTQSKAVFTATGFTVTTKPSAEEEVSEGSYTYLRYSPVGGLVKMDYTSPTDMAGTVGYIIVTYSASKAGSYFETFIPPGSSTGTGQTDHGTFTVP
jgi:hypothetical protein